MNQPTLEQLKAHAFDIHSQIQYLQNQYQHVLKKIGELSQEASEPKEDKSKEQPKKKK